MDVLNEVHWMKHEIQSLSQYFDILHGLVWNLTYPKWWKTST